MNRRDLLLQQMGIVQWQLRRPEVMKGAVNIAVAEHIRLIVIAEQQLSAQDHFIRDILRSAGLDSQDCLFIDFARADYLNLQHPLIYWRLGEKPEKTDRTLPPGSILWQSPGLTELKRDPQAKRRLWQHIHTAPGQQD